MTQWSLNPVFESFWLVGVLIAGLISLLLVRPRYARLRPWQRRVLLLLRGTLFGLLGLALLRPTLIHSSTAPQSSLLLILLDESRSMQLPHAVGGASRWEAQRQALRAATEELKAFAEEMDVSIYGYAESLREREFDGKQFALPESPDGTQTDIGTNLHAALRREMGRRMAGIVLLGDGSQNAFAPNVDLQQAGQEVARMDYPLFTVTFGPPGDATQARDVAVESLPERYTVFARNELAVQGTLRLRGYVNQPVSVELLVRSPDGRQTVLGPIDVLVREDDQATTAELTVTPEVPGEYKLTLRAAEMPGELITQNNQLTAFLTVLEGGLRVLYVYGDLLGEQRLLRRSLAASPDIQLDTLFVDARNRARWPVAIEEQLAQQDYDVVLFENVDAKALAESELRALSERVNRGLGFMMLGGFNSFGPGGYYATPLSDVLPVRMGRFERQDLDPQREVSRDLHWWDELVVQPSRAHPLTQLVGNAGNADLWRSLPPLLGANRFQLKPASQVLLESTEGHPILVAGTYGSGRVLAFAGNSTYRWWQLGRQREHRMFWRQAILWLAQRNDLNQNEVWVKLPQRRFVVGSAVEFTAGVQDATGEPLANLTWEARLTAPGSPPRNVDLRPAQTDYRGQIESLERPGDYLLEVSASRDGTSIGTAQASFQVIDHDLEFSNPSADYARMSQLALLTRHAGGRPIAPEQLAGLLRELRDQQRQVRVEILRRWQLGDTALDAWLLFLAVVALVSSEWVLRKRWGLA